MIRFLDQPSGHYEQHHPNDFALLTRHIRTGDVLLVEGHLRVSSMIKFLTHSSWSHVALYVGDELLRGGGALRDLAVEHFGDEAEHMVVEALMEGVVASPLSKYVDHNLRICRPHRLRPAHLAEVVEHAIEAIGHRYDLKNVVELALHLARVSLLPARYRRRALRFGSGTSGQVICTSMLGEAFQRVGFPVLPSISHPKAPGEPDRALKRLSLWKPSNEPYRGVYRRRHPTLLMPRDFDHSPYFEVVKFNVVGQRRFDYARIAWAEDEKTPSSEDVA